MQQDYLRVPASGTRAPLLGVPPKRSCLKLLSLWPVLLIALFGSGVRTCTVAITLVPREM